MGHTKTPGTRSGAGTTRHVKDTVGAQWRRSKNSVDTVDTQEDSSRQQYAVDTQEDSSTQQHTEDTQEGKNAEEE